MNGNGLAGVVVVLELVVDLVNQGVDAGNRLELDASEDGALEGLRECLVDLGGAGELAKHTLVSCEEEGGKIDGTGWATDAGRTSLSSASKKVKPE